MLFLSVFVVLMVLGVPLAFTVGMPALLYIFNDPFTPITIGVQRMISITQNFPLLAVPFFVLAGNLMIETGITKRLVKFSTYLTGHIIGGLSHVTIVLSALMGGISGSAVADASMQSRLLGPTMIEERGFSKGYSAGVIGLSGLITSTIPPSIGLIQYGYVGEVSIGRLFVAGVVPGILMAIFMMVAAYIVSKKKDYEPVREERASLKEISISFKNSFLALIFPFVLIMGIRFGVFTPTEGGAFAVVYSFVIGKFVYKEITWEKLEEVLGQALIDVGVIMFIIACSGIFGYVITTEKLPATVAQFLIGITEQPLLLLFIILGFLLLAGMVMEATVNVLLLTPIFLPIIKQVGIDPVHFGILMVVMLTMGGLTPPVGVAMYAVCSILDVPIDEYAVESLPFILSVIVLLVVLAIFPQLVMFLPNLIY